LLENPDEDPKIAELALHTLRPGWSPKWPARWTKEMPMTDGLHQSRRAPDRLPHIFVRAIETSDFDRRLQLVEADAPITRTPRRA
jgi:hypothetical protein